MSRGRPAGSSRANTATISDDQQVMTQVWHNLVDTLRLLPAVPPTASKSNNSDVDTRDLQQLQGDKKTLDDALEKISMLIGLRRGEALAAETLAPIIPIVSVSTPGSSGTANGNGNGNGTKRKRRLSVSVSASPAPQPHPPALSESVTSPMPSIRGGTPNSRELINKHKKEMYHDQLPLQPGRKVAFKVPSAKQKGEGGGDGEEENWILATIKRCITNDRMRYEVQDFDDETVSYNTTLRNIIPLPDPTSPSHLSSHPSNLEDFPKGTQVLGLYPETTSFYRATVVSAPLPGTGMGLGVRGSGASGRADPGAKRGVYRLSFVDDGDNVNDVDKCSVVLYPL